MKIGFISDIHEDIERLYLSIEILNKMKVDKVVCLGDIIGYSIPYYGYLNSRSANKCIKLISEICDEVVIGNHDLYAIKKTPETARDFIFPTNWYDLSFEQRVLCSQGKVYLYENNELPSLLNEYSLEYLSNLPEYKIINLDTYNILISHYAYPDITGSCTFELSIKDDCLDHLVFMKHLNCLYGFSGNDHIEGFDIYSQVDVKNIPFTSFTLNNEICWITGPTISNGTMQNGLLTFDSTSKVVTAIPLRTPLHKIPSSI